MNQRKRSAQQIHEGWVTFLRVLSRNSKLTFRIGKGVGPSTNGKVISLPALPENLTAYDLVMFESNAYHEVGHCIHSDIPWFQDFAKQYGKFAKFLLNALDDVFMERKQARHSRMAEAKFRKSAKIMDERKQFRDGSASPAEAVGCYCLTYLFSRNWPEYRGPHRVIEGNFDMHFGDHAEDLKSNLNQILDSEFPNVRSTSDAGALTLRIIAMLESQSQREEEEDDKDDTNEDKDESQTDPNQSSGEEEGEDDKSESESTDSDDADGGDNEVDDSSTPDTQDENASDGGDEEGDGGDEDSSQAKGRTLKEIVDEMLNEDLGDQEVFDKSKAMEGLSEQIQNGEHPDYSAVQVVEGFEVSGDVDDSSEPSSRGALGGTVQQFVDGMTIVESNRVAAKDLEKNIDRKANVLAAKLQSLLQNHEEDEVFSSRRGQLAEKNLYRIRLEDTRVFERKEAIERPTAAVSVCADLSGSTQVSHGLACKLCHKVGAVLTDRSRNAHCLLCLRHFVIDSNVVYETPAAMAIQESLLLLEKVLDQVGTPREIIGFAPKSGGTLNTVVRTFGDSHSTAVDRIGGLSSQVGGNSTPIGEAVFQAAIRLNIHASQKKVLFVLTDGEPSDEAKAVEMTNQAKASGIKVVFLLIGASVREDWLKEAGIAFAHAKTTAELCPILLDQVGALLA